MNIVEQRLPTRDQIEELQGHMSAMPQLDLSEHTKHYFADGMYCRELFRPAGTLIVGKVHKKEHFYMVMSGTIALVGDGSREEITGPRIIVSQPGTKRAVYAVTDATCTTVHRVSSQDLEEIERELIEPENMRLFDASNKPIKEALECHS